MPEPSGVACPGAPGQQLLSADPRRHEPWGGDPSMTPQHQAQHHPAGVEPVERPHDRFLYETLQPDGPMTENPS